jgi:hypothetical protein
MHNPETPGYVRALNFNVAAHGGVAGMPAVSPNGSTVGVGIAEFHFENGGTRPIQVTRNLIINNGSVTTGTRSARLELVLDEAPTVDMNGVPQNLGLFDVDFAFDSVIDNSNFWQGAISGTGALGLFFSSADGSTLYTQNAEIAATFGNTEYVWNISYTGKISWSGCDETTGTGLACVGADNGVVGTIAGTGGNDVVLIGLSSESTGLTGDHDGDGDVDAADYVFWRKTDGGNLQGYNDWRENFGETGSGSGGGGAVPEPASFGLVLLGVCAALLRRRA